MDSKNFYKTILDQISNDCSISNIQIGQSWVITSLQDGRTGMAAKMFDRLSLPINEIMQQYPTAHMLANQIDTNDLFISTLALSAINACNNSHEDIIENHLEFDKRELCTTGLSLDNKTLGIIGHMKRTYDLINASCSPKKIYMFDMDETKGDYPPESEPALLPECDVVIITATTLINHTITDVITWSEDAYKILYGPSAPLLESVPGIDRICGYYIFDKTAALQWNSENKGSPLLFCNPFKIDLDL